MTDREDLLNIGYFRVSMEGETIQDLDRQIEVVTEKFKIKFDFLFKERISAWDINKLHKRKEFIKLMHLLFKSNKTTLDDIFLKSFDKKTINLYIWDYSRIMRNIEFSLLFSILCTVFDVHIHSFKDGEFKMDEHMTPSEKLLKYLTLGIQAYSGEEYSYNTSENIKKSAKIDKDTGIRVSSKGNKWGGQLRYIDHTKEKKHFADVETAREVEKYVLRTIKKYTYQQTVDKVAEKFSIKITRAYISILSRRRNS